MTPITCHLRPTKLGRRFDQAIILQRLVMSFPVVVVSWPQGERQARELLAKVHQPGFPADVVTEFAERHAEDYCSVTIFEDADDAESGFGFLLGLDDTDIIIGTTSETHAQRIEPMVRRMAELIECSCIIE